METTLHDSATFSKNDNAQNSTKVDLKNNKKKSCQWNDDTIKLLLSFLIERKEEANHIVPNEVTVVIQKKSFGKTRQIYFLAVIASILSNSARLSGKTLKKKYGTT
ncbi:hypothetical protein RhiirA5_366592 [Rhizophagus irregularis]|uniref:Uncharacterized protein n=2 Tax=Rhizophagus irregularis TaxID=588596 RepID=A0A2N0NX79_9GLOM|nr:hypothetical protein RirG_111140 [Rhizophagus irregularis DAOM 197198w]PKB99174.1 hypothetical protein RhiirA5_366592 [Rhizophagus irregularis]GBC17327.1 hypothetical protein GLOIN_2v1786505 [Rhizophagus irregularis DAOM 181602=DAOM 197198]PKC55089.1 hypothetical protein RhiirA1_429667 [Rhizophagus irregularis]UZO05778.1 hypothetical protein OCT59_026118 [Rhizophagus irregularis]